MSRKASSSIADRKKEKSVGETSPPTVTFAIIPVYTASIIVVNFSGHPYFHSSLHSPVLPTVSNALLKSTNTIYSGRSCSLHLSCSGRRQNIIYIVLRLPVKPDSIVSSVLPYFSRNSISPRCFAIFQAGDCSSHLIHGWNLIEACLDNALRDVVHSFVIYVARAVE
ncbi:hypothetical protein NP493_2314g00003 [Ridgeia piscesae]|uniref:Uncharacterized protein n=1 Tax=Ridgeia piscesae TaxID=27915 RepID=A0AAD9JJM8_RIDPI|nr:hypothetical protein NP493_2314g00003 [Ridgeia piscesae]